MAEFASKGVAGTGLGLGIAGTALGLMRNNILGYGGLFNAGPGVADCFVNRLELAQQNEISNKDMEIAYLRSAKDTDAKLLETYTYIDRRFREFEQRFCEQAVINERTTQVLSCAKQQLDALETLVNSFTTTKVRQDMICPPIATTT